MYETGTKNGVKFRRQAYILRSFLRILMDSQGASQGANSATAPVIPKLRRFNFTAQYDLDLLKAIRGTDAHIFQRGKTEALYHEVLTSFLSLIPPAVFDSTKKPSPKTLKDRFKLFCVQHRSNDSKNRNASGIAEDHGEKEILLDDLIQEMDLKDEASMRAKLRQTESEKLLENAGDFIRTSALKRRLSASEDTPKLKKSKQNHRSTTEDEVTQSLLAQAAKKQELASETLVLQKKRFEHEVARAVEEQKRFEKTHEADMRRLDLDERRLELELEERRLAMTERSKMIYVLSLLAAGLNKN